MKKPPPSPRTATPGRATNHQNPSSKHNSRSNTSFSNSTNYHKKTPSAFSSIKAALSRLFACTGSPAPDAGRLREIPSISVDNSVASSAGFKYRRDSAGSEKAAVGQAGRAEFSFEEICKATGNFAPGNIIGEGGFGVVYKGKLKDGSLMAVKRVKKDMYDRHLSKEFRNEILTLSQIEHLNLVRFFGYVEHGDERIILVEYVANGTLREHLDGIHEKELEIAERLDIAIDVAHAVTYLHMYTDPPIIHRDIKASNILITEKLRAKVADFGFARIAVEDPEATHISTQVKGTAGYLDPEYLKTYQLTDRSDVYSFGVLLVELMTGRQPIELKKTIKERVTTQWAMQKLKQGEVVMAMDPRLRRSPASLLVVEKVLKLARQCLAPSRPSRPSMKNCAEVLWRIRKDFVEKSLPGDASTSIYSANVFEGDAKKNRHEYFGIEDSDNYRYRSA